MKKLIVLLMVVLIVINVSAGTINQNSGYERHILGMATVNYGSMYFLRHDESWKPPLISASLAWSANTLTECYQYSKDGNWDKNDFTLGCASFPVFVITNYGIKLISDAIFGKPQPKRTWRRGFNYNGCTIINIRGKNESTNTK